MGNKFKRVPADVPVSDLSPLNISCSSTKCEDNLHYFKTSLSSVKKFGESGVCRECGIKLVDWDRIHKNNIKDAKFIFNSMKHELIRHVYWHTPIDQGAIDKALRSTTTKMRIHAEKVIKSKLGKSGNAWDGQQTPQAGNEIVHYAQHATATCCRKCLEYWHNIKRDIILSDGQIEYCTDLIMLYIEERVPELPK